MSQEAQTQSPAPVQPLNPPRVPLIIQYQQQLAAFIQQREQVKVQFEQLQGAVFACEQMIKQYEESAKQSAMDLANKVALEAVTPIGNQGEMNGQANDQAKKQAAQK